MSKIRFFLTPSLIDCQDCEDEERRLSVEGSLLDLRTYVENILTETNGQLGGIAVEVDAAQEKISKVNHGVLGFIKNSKEWINFSEITQIGYGHCAQIFTAQVNLRVESIPRNLS